MKKYLLGFCALVLAIGMSAFTSVKQDAGKTSFTDVWFVYNGGGEGIPANYSVYGQAGEFPPPCTDQTGDLCGILAPQIGPYPDLDHISDQRFIIMPK